MALPGSAPDREYQKFFETNDGKTAVRIGGTGTLVEGLKYDSISATYPDTTTEVYRYYEGGLAGTLVGTVTVVYNSSTKNEIVSVVRS